eukprot:1157919-Pelagomonas_calceolata.AAC.3
MQVQGVFWKQGVRRLTLILLVSELPMHLLFKHAQQVVCKQSAAGPVSLHPHASLFYLFFPT